MENNPNEKALFDKYRKGQTTPDEDKYIHHAFNLFADSVAEDTSLFEAKQVGEKIWSKLPSEAKKTSTRRLWLIYSSVAVAATILIALGIIIKTSNNPTVVLMDEQAKLITPGKQGATLTLSDGTKIKLSDAVNGQLANESGISVSKSKTGELIYEIIGTQKNSNTKNTLSTANGETYSIKLPDNSKVMMNAGSSLTYSPSLLVNGKRQVELTGEAYFEIAKDAKHPFVVSTANQTVTVLGTHFNVKAYQTETQVRTTLAEGSVQINNDQVLKPGEVAINGQNGIKILTANMEQELAWIHNDFFFRNAATEAVMDEMARWYNLTVTYSSEEAKAIKLSGQIARSRSLVTVLERLGAATHLQFNISGKNVFVEKR